MRPEIPAAFRKTRVFVQRPPSGGTGNTPAEAPKYPLGGMDLVRTPASGAGDGGSTPSRPTMVGRTYLERGEPVVVLVRWGPGGGPRNVLIQRADGSRVVRPFRGLRKPRST